MGREGGHTTILSRVPWWMLPCRDLWLSVSSTWHGTPQKKAELALFFFSPHDSAVDEISFISIIFNWQLNSENDVSLLLGHFEWFQNYSAWVNRDCRARSLLLPVIFIRKEIRFLFVFKAGKRTENAVCFLKEENRHIRFVMEKKKKIPREREREMPTNSVTSLVIFTLYMNRRAVKKRKSKRNKRISLPSRFTVVINVAGFYSFSVLVSSWFPHNSNVKSLIVNSSCRNFCWRNFLPFKRN